MKKDWYVLVFMLLYIMSFTLIYTVGFIGLDYFVIIFFLYMIINAPSLILTLLLLAFERIKKKNISNYVYLGLSLLIITLVLWDWKKPQDSGNYLYPVFKESIYTLFFISLCSHIIAFLGFKGVKKIVTNYAA